MNFSELPLNTDFVMMVAAIVLALLIFTGLLRIARAAIGIVVPIALLLLVLQFVFGITPIELWVYLTDFVQSLWYTLGESKWRF